MLRGACATLVIALVGASTRAAAEPSAADKESSRSLFKEGSDFLGVGNYAGAERACRSAYKLVAAPTPGLCLGRALVGLGKFVEAREILLGVARLPAKADEPAVITTAREAARTEAERLVARIPTITIGVSGPGENATLHASLDGEDVAPDTVRVARKVNPGAHVVVVGATGFADARESFGLREGEQKTLEVVLQAVTTTSAPEKTSPPTGAYVAFAVGGAGLVVGTVSGVLAYRTKSDCASDGTCASQSDADRFQSERTIAFVGFGVAIVGGGVGAWLLLSKKAPARAEITPWIGLGTAGVRGRF